MIKKVILILGLYILSGTILESCNSIGKIENQYFLIDEVHMGHFSYQTNFNSPCLDMTTPESDSINSSNFGISFMFTSETFYKASTDFASLFSKSMALSPPPPIYDSEITNIRIRCDMQIDEDHEAFSDITELFEVANVDYNHCSSFSPPFSILQYIKDNFALHEPYYLRLNVPIEQAGIYRFFIEIEQDDSKIPFVEGVGNPVILKL